MRAVVALLLLHVLCWGAVGAALAPRAGFPRWVGALISTLLPGLGLLILIGLGLSARSEQPRRLGPAAVALASFAAAGGVLVLVGSWLGWVKLKVGAEAGPISDEISAFNSSSVDALPIIGTVLAVLLIGFSLAAAVRRRPGWLCGTALVAWGPAAISLLVVGTAATIEATTDHVDTIGELLAVLGLDGVSVDGDYLLGPGPYTVMLGSLLALVANFIAALLPGAPRPTPTATSAALPLVPSTSIATSTPPHAPRPVAHAEVEAPPAWDRDWGRPARSAATQWDEPAPALDPGWDPEPSGTSPWDEPRPDGSESQW